MATKKRTPFIFRFNPNEEDLLEEIFSSTQDSDETLDDVLSSTPTTTTKTDSPKSDITERRVKSSTSENSVKDFFTSRIHRVRSLDQSLIDYNALNTNTNNVNTSKWFNRKWLNGKIQQMIEERKERSRKEKELTELDSKKDETNDFVILDNENFDFINSPSEQIQEKTTDSKEILSRNQTEIKENEVKKDDLTINKKNQCNCFNIFNLLVHYRNVNAYFHLTFLISIIGVLCSLRSPLPSYINGFIVGLLLSYLWLGAIVFALISKFFITKNKFEKEDKMSINEIEEVESENEIKHKGWLYQMVTGTSSIKEDEEKKRKLELIFIRIDGRILRVSVPKSSMKGKRLSDNTYSGLIDKERYDLLNIKKISLRLPSSITNKKKYMWTKNCPIILTFDGKEKGGLDYELVLFARNNRDKEQWYWRFKEVVVHELEKSISNNECDSQNAFLESLKCQTSSELTAKYNNYISSILSDSSQYLWFNALAGRIGYDFITKPYWSEWVTKKITKKLELLKLPSFLKAIALKDISLGKRLPVLSGVRDVRCDSKGVWCECDVIYEGGLRMTLETKLNLMGSKTEQEIKISDYERYIEEDEEEMCDVDGDNGPTIIKFVDRIAASKIFQQTTDSKFFKKAMLEVSNTSLLLTVDVVELSGILCINIPPPPSDRLWYGFRSDPKLVLSAKPQWGERIVSVSLVIGWIQKKLIQEFNKILVMPNMDDIVLSVMMTSDCVDICD